MGEDVRVADDGGFYFVGTAGRHNVLRSWLQLDDGSHLLYDDGSANLAVRFSQPDGGWGAPKSLSQA